MQTQEDSVANLGHCFWNVATLIYNNEPIALSQDFAISGVKTFEKGSKVNTFIELEASAKFSEAKNYWMYGIAIYCFSSCFCMNTYLHSDSLSLIRQLQELVNVNL